MTDQKYLMAKTEVEKLLTKGWTRVGIEEIYPDLWTAYISAPTENFYSSGKNYHKQLEDKEHRAEESMKNAGVRLDKRAQELLESGEAKDYRAAMKRAMDEMPEEKRAYLQKLEG